ncbi:unnamed protein product, partial [Ectocarpus fasciculatus]
MDGFEISKNTKNALVRSKLRQGDEALFTSGPYGHGSRAFAKVVETVTARLETRLAAAGGDRAAAAALAGKVDKAWRDMYKRPLPSEAEVMHNILTVSPADAQPSRHCAAASSDLRRSTGARPQTAANLPSTNKQSIATANAATAKRTPKRKFVLKAVIANKKHRVGSSTNAAAAAGVKRRRANTAATTERDPTAERRRVDAAQGADGRVPLAAGAGAGPGGVSAAAGAADAVASGASTVAVTAALPSAMACGDGSSRGGGELGGGEKTAAVAQGRAVARGGRVGAEPAREKEATDGPRPEQTPSSPSGSATIAADDAAADDAAPPLAGTAAAPTPPSQVEGREKQVTTTDERAAAAPAGLGQAARAQGRQPTEKAAATAIGDEPAREEELGADEFDLGPTKSSGHGGVQSRTMRGGDGDQVDGGGGGGGGEAC